MDYPDYYALLGVPLDASSEHIQQAYRRLVRDYHPDLHQGDPHAEDMLKQINEAYEVLSNGEKRRKYDQLARGFNHWQQRGSHEDAGLWQTWNAPDDARFPPADSIESSTFVSDVAHMSPNRSSSQSASPNNFHGHDLELTARLTLEEAYNGATRSFLAGSRPITVPIPPGAYDGLRVRLNGQGDIGYVGGQPGDLYVRVELLAHPLFDRVDDDLHFTLDLDVYTAVLGGSICIPTLNDEVEMQLQPGTQSGVAIRVKGGGMPHLKAPNTYGDLYAHARIYVPTSLSARERQLFEQLRALQHRR